MTTLIASLRANPRPVRTVCFVVLACIAFASLLAQKIKAATPR